MGEIPWGGLGTLSAGPYPTKKSSFCELVACGHCFYTGFRASVQTVYGKAYMYAFGILVVTWTCSVAASPHGYFGSSDCENYVSVQGDGPERVLNFGTRCALKLSAQTLSQGAWEIWEAFKKIGAFAGVFLMGVIVYS